MVYMCISSWKKGCFGADLILIFGALLLHVLAIIGWKN